MDNGRRVQWSALVVSLIALFFALGGGVYAATKLSGKAIKLKSLPGNRLALHSVPANRLKPGVLTAPSTPSGTPSRELTGADINETTLAQVPNAVHADTADSARTAQDAQTAINAINAVNAEKINGHSAGCLQGTRLFAGACWEASPHGPETAPAAAADCALRGGALPEALQLVAFSQAPGIVLAAGNEWSSDLVNFSGENVYGVATVSPAGVVGSAAFNGGGISGTKKYRCVFPLVI